MTLTDESSMPFGKHKGTEMANVPASYLLWLYGQYNQQKPFGEASIAVKDYILDNLDALKKEAVKANAWKNCDATESDLY